MSQTKSGRAKEGLAAASIRRGGDVKRKMAKNNKKKPAKKPVKEKKTEEKTENTAKTGDANIPG
jgi:hypothetical protein